jgi:glycosyltransferase involved in cell wall biosynthesis
MSDRLTSTSPRVGVVIPATDAAPFLDRCLTSLAAAADGPDEVIVVDEPSMSVVEARNAGARRASAEILVFIDSDVLVHADAFTRIRAAFAADGDLAGVIGSYDDSPTADGAISGFRNLLHHHVCVAASGPVSTFWTGLGAIRRDAFESASGFDDDLRWPRQSRDQRDFMADVSLGIRLAEAGHRLVLDPGIQGTHAKRWTLSQMVYTDFLLRGVPWVRLLLRRKHAPSYLNLGWRHRISALVSLLSIGALFRRRAARFAAMLTALVVLNRAFYMLLLRRRGPAQAVAGIFVHIIHHLASLASLFAGIAIHLSERSPGAALPAKPAPVEPACAEPASAEVIAPRLSANAARARPDQPHRNGSAVPSQRRFQNGSRSLSFRGHKPARAKAHAGP